MTTDWLTSTLAALPALIWMVVGVGLPYALMALPRRDWRQKLLVAVLALAFGPALVTAWMFVPGTLGMDSTPNPGATPNPMQTIVPDHIGGMGLLTPVNILAGTALIALIGWLMVWRKWRAHAEPESVPVTPLFWDERLLIALIVIATIGRWFITSILNFGSWDPLWVYGYQGKLYTLIGYIPADIGYYPQFLSLQYAYTQIMSGGVDDHAARAVMPLLQVGSILAAYTLGRLSFSRRVGIFAAALWALYPHFGYWTRIGDLEIPMTFTFTLAAAFFLAAWHTDESAVRRRYALIAGLSLGIALWTKPTAGALVWGVMLVVMVGFALAMIGAGKNRLATISSFLRGPRFESAFLMGLATLPLGGLWYARNIALGHAAVVFPPGYWTGEAGRGGAEFGWPLLALGILLAYAYLAPLAKRPDWRFVAPGLLLIVAAVAPTITAPSGFFGPNRMGALEWAALVAGCVLVGLALWRWRSALHHNQREDVRKLAVSALLVLPYFITWFISYSYHYRLSFAIVPLMSLPVAVILGRWWFTEPVIVLRKMRVPRVVYGFALLLVGLPGVVTTAYDDHFKWEYIDFLTKPPSGEAAIESVVRVLRAWQTTHDAPLHVIAPGFQRLPFAFPLDRIDVAQTPRIYDQVEGATHFIDGSDALFAYAAGDEVAPYQNQLLIGMQRPRLVTDSGTFEDAAFFYAVRELHLARRFDLPEFTTAAADSVIFADCASLRGYTIEPPAAFIPGAQIRLRMVWESLDQCAADYSIYVHLYARAENGESETFIASIGDGPVRVGINARGYYSTLFWDRGEFIIDERVLSLPDDGSIPAEANLRVQIGFYDVKDNARATVTHDNGDSTGDADSTSDGFTLLEIAR